MINSKYLKQKSATAVFSGLLIIIEKVLLYYDL